MLNVQALLPGLTNHSLIHLNLHPYDPIVSKVVMYGPESVQMFMHNC